MHIIDEKITSRWINYVTQSAAAGLSIFVLALFTPRINLVLVAAAGATAFTVFAIPHHVTAKPRNVIGGQTLGALSGVVCSTIYIEPVSGGIAVGLATLLMVSFDAEHPPGAGAALGLALGASFERAAFIISAAIILSLIKAGLSEHLVDLT